MRVAVCACVCVCAGGGLQGHREPACVCTCAPRPCVLWGLQQPGVCVSVCVLRCVCMCVVVCVCLRSKTLCALGFAAARCVCNV